MSKYTDHAILDQEDWVIEWAERKREKGWTREQIDDGLDIHRGRIEAMRKGRERLNKSHDRALVIALVVFFGFFAACILVVRFALFGGAS